MKAYNFKYDSVTRSKLREIQEFLESEKQRVTINEVLVYSINEAFAKLKKYEKSNLFNNNTDSAN